MRRLASCCAPAAWFRYFNRDVECIRRFFKRRFRYESNIYPRFRTIKAEQGADDGSGAWHLDLVVCASGYDKGEQRVLEEVRATIKLRIWSGMHECSIGVQYMDSIQQEKTEAGSEEEETGSGGEEDESDEEEEEEFSEEDGDGFLDDREGGGEGEEAGGSEAVAGALSGGHESREHGGHNLARGSTHDEAPEGAHGPSDDDDVPSGADSPRRSGSPSRSRSRADRTGGMSVGPGGDIRDKVQSEVSKQRGREQRKYHSKKSAQRRGERQKGSKRKQDTRIKVDGGGFWD